jgi:hypothetical protein
MHFQFETPPYIAPLLAEPPSPPPVPETVDLLRQLLDVQREQLAQLRATAAAHDIGSRWRAFLSRWQQDFPELSDACRQSLPILERTYGKLIAELTDHLCQNGGDALDNDFALQEFLDRYGMRLAQLGTILNLVAPLAEAGPPQGETG